MKHHKAAHFRFSHRAFFIGLGALVLVCCFHFLFGDSESVWLQATALRLYYLPVILGALFGGLIVGLALGLISAATHYTVMLSIHWSNQSLAAEHTIELPFILVSGLLIGMLTDHYDHSEKQKDSIRDALNRQTSVEVADQIIANEISTEGENFEATVLFTDIWSFTKLSENMTPKELLQLLNNYFSDITIPLLENGAFIDKFIGDAIMAVFGVPIPDANSAAKSIRAAIAMQHALHHLNNHHKESNIRISIGIHTGKLTAGIIGSEKRQDYTVIGDTVNVASRLESLNRLYNSDILISGATRQAIGQDDELFIREVDLVKVKGRSHPIQVYEVYNCCLGEEKKLKDASIPILTDGMNEYRNGNWSKAKNCFDDIIRSNSADMIARLYLERISLLERQNPKSWDGVFDFNQR